MLQKRKQDVDLVDVNFRNGDAIGHVETDHRVARKISREALKSNPKPSPNASQVERTKLTGHTARRKGDGTVHVVWDTLYPGFGLRFRESGHKTWIVNYRQRKIKRTVTLGSVPEMAIKEARREARRILSGVQLEGLPTRPNEQVKCAPLFRDYVEEFWADYSRHWKLSTARRSRSSLKLQLIPYFGDMTVDAIRKTDIARFRDGLADQPVSFNRAIPVLSVMMKYAEQLGYRRANSNPCKGTPRYKTRLVERYLSPIEYRRLASALEKYQSRYPEQVNIIWLLMFTGARLGEIQSLRWEYVKPPRLMLPDSKTGAKMIYLNQQAQSILDGLPNKRDGGLVFSSRTKPSKPVSIRIAWNRIRRHAAIPDVRLHDLRHSFASLAIGDGISLLVIGKLLGHALPETTARYAHLADQTVQDSASRVCSSIASAMGVGQ